MFGRKKKWNTLRAALQQNDATATRAAAGRIKLRRKKNYYDACVIAIRRGSADALKALLKAGDGFDFSRRKYQLGWGLTPMLDAGKQKRENQRLARELVKEAYNSPSPESLLPVLYAHRGAFLNTGDFLTSQAPLKLLDVCLESKWPPDFRECVYRTGLADTAKLDYILTFTTNNDSETLARALIWVAGRGDADKATLLLTRGARADFDNAEALRLAAKNERGKMVDLLLPHVALELHGDKIVTQLRLTEGDPAIIAAIESATQKKVAGAWKQGAESYAALDGNTLEQNHVLSDGARLKIISDFRAEREMLFFTAKGASEPTMQVVNFAEIKAEVLEDKRRKLDELNSKRPSAPQSRI